MSARSSPFRLLSVGPLPSTAPTNIFLCLLQVEEGRQRERAAARGGVSGAGGSGTPGAGAEADGEGKVGGGGSRAVGYTRLFSKNEDVDRLNSQELKKLDGKNRFLKNKTKQKQNGFSCCCCCRVMLCLLSAPGV